MCKGLFINVGKVIHTEMRAMANLQKQNQAVGFPSLIIALCKNTGLRALSHPAEQIALITEMTWKKKRLEGTLKLQLAKSEGTFG